MRRLVAPNTEVFTFTPITVPPDASYLDNQKLLETNPVIKRVLSYPLDWDNKKKYEKSCLLNMGNFSKLYITDFELHEPVQKDIMMRFMIDYSVVGEWPVPKNTSEFQVPIGDNKDTVSILLTHTDGGTGFRPYAHCNFMPTWLGIYCCKRIEFCTIDSNLRTVSPVNCSFKLRADTLEFSRVLQHIIYKDTWTTFSVRSQLGHKMLYSLAYGTLQVASENPKVLRHEMQQGYSKKNQEYLGDFHEQIRKNCKLVPSKTCLRSGL